MQAYIIDELLREERERESQQPELRIEIEMPRYEPLPKEEEKVERGVWIIELL